MFTHACMSCTCTVPTLADHAAKSMGPHHLRHFDLHRCGGLLQVCICSMFTRTRKRALSALCGRVFLHVAVVPFE